MFKDLLTWYDNNRRILPWREDPAPYHVWLSEIMLQQTRVEAVRSYYARFLETLPDIASLAAADEDTYLKLWEGLGYYSRVRNLHKAAVQIMNDYDGRMPETSAELKKLSGIGPYTAAAIASIAFGERIPAVDGNLLRIFARLTCYGQDIKAPAAKKAAEAFYLEHFPETRAGDCNQALMDLGATVCVPNGAPLCGECPWSDLCQAHREGSELDFPYAAPKKDRRIEDRTVFLIYYDRRLVLGRRPSKGLLAGLYEFPNALGRLSRSEALDYLSGLGFSAVRITELPKAKHIFSHIEWHMTGYEVLADEWKGFPEAAAGAEASNHQPEGQNLFLATREEMQHLYSIPSAFASYRREIRFR